MDVTSDMVDAEHLLYGYTAHDTSGAQIIGTYVESALSMQTKMATPSRALPSHQASPASATGRLVAAMAFLNTIYYPLYLRF